MTWGNERLRRIAGFESVAARKLSLLGSQQLTLLVPLASDGMSLNSNRLGVKGQLHAITKDDVGIDIWLDTTATKSAKIGNCSIH